MKECTKAYKRKKNPIKRKGVQTLIREVDPKPKH